jgi:hypothetical protein
MVLRGCAVAQYCALSSAKFWCYITADERTFTNNFV